MKTSLLAAVALAATVAMPAFAADVSGTAPAPKAHHAKAAKEGSKVEHKMAKKHTKGHMMKAGKKAADDSSNPPVGE